MIGPMTKRTKESESINKTTTRIRARRVLIAGGYTLVFVFLKESESI